MTVIVILIKLAVLLMLFVDYKCRYKKIWVRYALILLSLVVVFCSTITENLFDGSAYSAMAVMWLCNTYLGLKNGVYDEKDNADDTR